MNTPAHLVVSLVLLGRRQRPQFDLPIAIAATLPMHHNDAHRHFFPFSNWKFVSPVSYWDPEHFGWLGGLIELLTVVACVVCLLWRWRGRRRRWVAWAIGGPCGLLAVAITGWWLLGSSV